MHAIFTVLEYYCIVQDLRKNKNKQFMHNTVYVNVLRFLKKLALCGTCTYVYEGQTDSTFSWVCPCGSVDDVACFLIGQNTFHTLGMRRASLRCECAHASCRSNSQQTNVHRSGICTAFPRCGSGSVCAEWTSG